MKMCTMTGIIPSFANKDVNKPVLILPQVRVDIQPGSIGRYFLMKTYQNQ